MSAKLFHIPLVQVTSSFVLHSIVQRTPKPNDDASKDHPSAKIYHSAEEMFADTSIDIIAGAFRIAVLPAARAYAIDRIPRMKAAFHGAMARMTPYGSL